ncbi:MAG: HNH endonuclease [Paludibacter sp.]|jgi:hypothetical protein|nr:HNH endonuclease [Paludibacter sp.]
MKQLIIIKKDMNLNFDTIKADETTLNHDGYGASLFDPRWKARRKEILERDHYKCVICHSEIKLQVHHRQYQFSETLKVFKNPWEYADSLMITLCSTCHQKGHNLYKVPIKYIK